MPNTDYNFLPAKELIERIGAFVPLETARITFSFTPDIRVDEEGTLGCFQCMPWGEATENRFTVENSTRFCDCFWSTIGNGFNILDPENTSFSSGLGALNLPKTVEFLESADSMVPGNDVSADLDKLDVFSFMVTSSVFLNDGPWSTIIKSSLERVYSRYRSWVKHQPDDFINYLVTSSVPDGGADVKNSSLYEDVWNALPKSLRIKDASTEALKSLQEQVKQFVVDTHKVILADNLKLATQNSWILVDLEHVRSRWTPVVSISDSSKVGFVPEIFRFTQLAENFPQTLIWEAPEGFTLTEEFVEIFLGLYRGLSYDKLTGSVSGAASAALELLK